MELRHGIHHRLAFAIARPFEQRGLLEPGKVIVVRQLHALGQARGARRVELDHVIIAPHGEAGIRGRLGVAPGWIEIPVLAVAVQRDDPLQVRQLRLDLVDHGVEFLADEQHLGAGVREDELHLRRRQPRVDAVHHRARLGAAEHHLVIDVRVLREITDPVVRLDAERKQAVGNLARALVEIGIGRHLAFEPQRRLGGAPCGLHARNVCQVRHRLNVDHRSPPTFLWNRTYGISCPCQPPLTTQAQGLLSSLFGKADICAIVRLMGERISRRSSGDD